MSNFELSVEINPGFLSFASLRFVIGPEKFAPFSQSIKFQTKSNRDLVARVFPRFWWFFFFLIALMLLTIFSFVLICFAITSVLVCDTQSKCTLAMEENYT